MKTINTYIYNIKHIKNYINEKLRLTTKRTYTCQPIDKDVLRRIIIERIKDEGPNCDLNDIDTSKITDMSQLFATYVNSIFKNFNGDISMWNVSNVRDMHYMFYGCYEFNSYISSWNVSNVKYINHMFGYCEKFKQDLDSWDVSKVENMNYAFYKCPTQPTWYDKDKCESK